MRTTIEFDPDVAVELKRMRKASAMNLKELVNDLVRRGIRDLTAPSKRKKPFRTKAVDLGKPLLPNVDNVHEILAYAEGENYK